MGGGCLRELRPLWVKFSSLEYGNCRDPCANAAAVFSKSQFPIDKFSFLVLARDTIMLQHLGEVLFNERWFHCMLKRTPIKQNLVTTNIFCQSFDLPLYRGWYIYYEIPCLTAFPNTENTFENTKRTVVTEYCRRTLARHLIECLIFNVNGN